MIDLNWYYPLVNKPNLEIPQSRYFSPMAISDQMQVGNDLLEIEVISDFYLEDNEIKNSKKLLSIIQWSKRVII